MNGEDRTYSKSILKTKKLPIALLFMVWPFALLYTSLKNFRAHGAKQGFILFCLYFGFVFVISQDLGGADSARYAQMLRNLHQQTPSFANLWASLYSYNSTQLDIYQPLTTWIFALFTDNAHFLFAFFAFVFGWFYANNLWIILRKVQGKVTPIILLFIIVFALILPIWSINGVRMWTAAQIFIYSTLLYFTGNEKKKGLLWAGASIFVHFSFLFPVAIFVVYRFIPKKLIVFFIFYILTLLISSVDLYTIKDYMRLLPEIFQPRVESYTNVDYAEGLIKEKAAINWYVGFSEIALKIVINSLLIVIIFHSRKFLVENKMLYQLICFILFLGIWANLLSAMPSGGRFLSITNSLFVIFIIFYFLQYKVNATIKVIRFLSIPLLVFYCIFSIRVGFDYMGISTFIGNPIAALIFEDNTPLIELIKSFL